MKPQHNSANCWPALSLGIMGAKAVCCVSKTILSASRAREYASSFMRISFLSKFGCQRLKCTHFAKSSLIVDTDLWIPEPQDPRTETDSSKSISMHQPRTRVKQSVKPRQHEVVAGIVGFLISQRNGSIKQRFFAHGVIVSAARSGFHPYFPIGSWYASTVRRGVFLRIPFILNAVE